MYNDEFNNNDMYRFTNRDVPRDDYVPVQRQEQPHAAPAAKQGFFRRTWVKVTALVLACAVVGGAAGYGGAALAKGGSSGGTVINESSRPATTVQVKKVDGKTRMQPAEVYASTVNSAVSINCSSQSTNIFGQTTQSASSGSGFVITEDGYIVTNYHVVNGASSVQVTLYNGDTYDATVVGGDSDYDVAVLKINATGLTPVTLGDSADVNVGDTVLAIGNPLGELTYTLTDGIVSALDRLITTSSTNANGRTESVTLNVLQTNCAINPGNSGGPLFDQYGSVVGIVSAKYTQSTSGVSAEGLGFALPINDVKEIIADLIEHGYVTGKPYMGVQVDSVSSEAQRYGIPAGAAVSYVADGSCAQKAGLQVNDVITAIDDTAIDSPSALTAALSTGYKAGDTATLTVIRSQKELKLTITFDEKNAQTEANNQQQTQQSQQQQGQSGYSQWPFGGSWPFG